MKFLSVLLSVALAGASPLAAQGPSARPAPPAPPTGEVRGSVVDAENNAPIASASVAVWTKADAKLVAGVIVREDGSFRVEGLRPGTYYLRLSMIGYAPHNTEPFTVSEAAPRAVLGSIKLTRAAVEVAGVVATAEKQMTIAPDRNSYRVKDVAPAAGNASDVLENVPSVSVDGDGKVSLRGNENVVIQINGRPTPITGAQLAGYLRQLPANTIERVEVIPNPSAKQDPEGMAGIINIVMKQGVDLGTSGGFTLLGSTADRYSASGQIGHQSGPLAVFFTYGFNSDQRKFNGLNDRTRLDAAGDPFSYTEQDLGGIGSNRGHNVSANADYQITKKDVLSTTLNFNRRDGSDDSRSFYNELDQNRTVMSQYDRVRNQSSDNWLADAFLSFKHTMVPQKHEISSEIRFNHQDDRDNTDLWREAFVNATRTDLENDATDGATNQTTAQVDYTRPLGKQGKLETGYKGTARWLDRDYTVLKDENGTGVWSPSDLSNALSFDETVNAAYAVLSRSGKKFDVQGGLRAEYATRDFTLKSTNESFPHDYTSLFPSALVNYKMNDKSQLKLSYSRRIRRPGTQELNPFPVFFDVQNVFFGNPRLDPEYTDAIEFGYQRSGALGTLQFSPFYRHTSNIIRVNINTADSLAGREITSISFQNLDHGDSWGADLNTQLRFGKAVSGLLGANLFKMVTDGGSTSSLQSNGVAYSFRANATWNVNQATALIGNYFWRAPMNFEKGHFTGMAQANFALRQKLSNSLTATLRVSDPFETTKFGARLTDGSIIQATDRAFNARAAYLSVQYNFGQTPKLRQRKQEDQGQSSIPFGN